VTFVSGSVRSLLYRTDCKSEASKVKDTAELEREGSYGYDRTLTRQDSAQHIDQDSLNVTGVNQNN
jgi:hypothetical protein